MASRIKGITIEIGGDTTGLKKALTDVDKSIRDTQSDLKDVERLLKIDPKNTELLAQKQKLLTQAIADTSDKLKVLREAEKQVQQQMKEGKASQAQYDALKREIVATEQSERALSAQLKDTKAALDSQGDSMDKGVLKAELLKDALTKIAQKLVEVVKASVSYNARMESFTAAFTSFLGSAEEAQKAIANIKKDAATMPFGASELIEANQALITTGEAAEDARDNINALAAAVAATGGGNAELSRMSQNLAQIRNTGKATSVDIKQFANAGINIFGLLSDYAQATGQDVEDLEYTYENVTAAIRMSTEEGGRYYGAMEAQAQTYNGQLNSLKANIQDALGTTFQSVSDTLKNQVFPAISKALDSIDFEKLSAEIKSIVDAVAAIMPVVSAVVRLVFGAVGDVLSAIAPIADRIKEILNGVITFITSVFTGQWKKAWESLVSVAKNLFLGIVDTIIGAINTIIGTINRVIELITGKSGLISKIPTTSTWARTTTSSGSKVLPGGQNALMASGGVISRGSAIVGDNGPELLTMNGGVATVQPINNTTNVGGINLSVYGAQGQSVQELAEVVMDRIQSAVNSKGAVWA